MTMLEILKLHTQIREKIGFEGVTTDEFRINQRVKQTHLISATLFNLVLEGIEGQTSMKKKL